MFEAEARWLAREMARLDATALSPLLHLGSSDRRFREERQPWIHAELELPLAARGVRVVNADLKTAEGVDVVGDIFEAPVFERLRAMGFKALLCANILEHVVDPRAFARRCLEIVAADGIIVVTVPRSYPHHADPIDTMFRPSPEEVHALFPGTRILVAQTIATGSYRDVLRRKPWRILHFARLLVPFLSMRRWRRARARLHWLFNPYLVTCVVLRKESGIAAEGQPPARASASTSS
jgi:hypothetical protein